jgi:hypothetical protein
MDDRLLVRVLYAFADLDEQLHALAHGPLVPVAIRCNRDAGDILHHEIGPALRGRASELDLRGERFWLKAEHYCMCRPALLRFF